MYVNQNKSKSNYFYLFICKFMTTLKFNDFHTIGSNVMKQNLCTPPRKELFDGTNNAIRGSTVPEILPTKKNQKKLIDSL